jgi:hypothetical protein
MPFLCDSFIHYSTSILSRRTTRTARRGAGNKLASALRSERDQTKARSGQGIQFLPKVRRYIEAVECNLSQLLMGFLKNERPSTHNVVAARGKYLECRRAVLCYQNAFVGVAVKPIRRPDALAGHVRFDERGSRSLDFRTNLKVVAPHFHGVGGFR